MRSLFDLRRQISRDSALASYFPTQKKEYTAWVCDALTCCDILFAPLSVLAQAPAPPTVQDRRRGARPSRRIREVGGTGAPIRKKQIERNDDSSSFWSAFF